MVRSKQVPTHNANARRGIGPEVNHESEANTNAGPADLFLSFHSNDLQLTKRLRVAYPSLTKDADSVYQSRKQSAWWRDCWFIRKLPLKVRRCIYHHVIKGSTERITQERSSSYKCDSEGNMASALLGVCHRIRSEALPIYHARILVDIGSSVIPDAWFLQSAKVDRFEIKKIQFKAWRPDPPAEMVLHLLKQFPLMETLVIEAPPGGAHITINDAKGQYTDIRTQAPGFRALLTSDLFQDFVAGISIKSSIPTDQQRNLKKAQIALRKKEASQSRQHRVKLLLAIHVNIYSDMWLSWKAKKGESLKDLILPADDSIEPHMKAVMVLDYEAQEVELKVNHHSVMLDLD